MFENFTKSLQEALGKAKIIAEGQGNQFIESVHFISALLDKQESSGSKLFAAGGGSVREMQKILLSKIESLPIVSGEIQTSIGRSLSKLCTLAEKQSKNMGDSHVSIDAVLLALTESSCDAGNAARSSGLARDTLMSALEQIRKGGAQEGDNPEEKREALSKYCVDMTKLAREGKLDPVIGRDDEIRRTMQILQRRTKNNPVLIGEPGVGKTAVVEGLARRIVDGEVPEGLLGKKVLSLDMTALLAGAKYRGEFEERLKSVLDEIGKDEDGYVLFIDEIHTVVGAGRTDGAMDAGNMLKPALARGKLHCIGATTLDEYRMHVEKDPALERRFQKILLEEPNVESTIAILRGLKERYELHHGVEITDSAIISAAEMSNKYIQDRFLPDKAIDLMDEAAARVRTEMDSKPEEMDKLYRKVTQLKIEREAMSKDKDEAARKRIKLIDEDILKLSSSLADLEEEWAVEKSAATLTTSIKEEIETLKAQEAEARREGNLQKVAEIQYSLLPSAERKLKECELRQPGNGRLLRTKVGAEEIAEAVSRATGIPANKLSQSDRSKMLELEGLISKRVVGQSEAVSLVSKALRRSKARVSDPNRPLSSFLFLGPTGVGKTELCKALAEIVFDGEERVTRIDMSEYMESHSVARLIGAPPGYVGYEEGGQLTEAVRRRPYGVVLLDEIEKAHPEVFNVLLQVLDEGRMTDGKGRTVSFKNCVIVMTSNVGGAQISQSSDMPESVVRTMVLAELKTKFKPEFLNRIDETIIFTSLPKSKMKEIANIHLTHLKNRMESEGVSLSFTDAVVDHVANEGFDEEYGARPIKRAIRRIVEDELATEILTSGLIPGERMVCDIENGNVKFSKVEQKLD